MEVVSPQGLMYIAKLPLEETPLKRAVAQWRGDFEQSGQIYALVIELRIRPLQTSQAERRTKPKVYIWLMVRHINDSGVGLPPAQMEEIVLGAFVEWREKGAAAGTMTSGSRLYAAVRDHRQRVACPYP